MWAMNKMVVVMNDVAVDVESAVKDVRVVPREAIRTRGPLANEVLPVTREGARIPLVPDEVGAVAATGGARREICP